MENIAKETAAYLQGQIPNLIEFVIEVILALLVFFIGTKIVKWIRKIVKRSLERTKVDTGIYQFVDSVLKYILYGILIFSIGKNFGLDTTSVAAVLASSGVAIGLALQGSLSNFAGGILILLLKPFVVGDYIIEETNHCEGTVTEIQVFYTKLQTVDNKTIVIPNGPLSNNSITNVTAQKKRQLDLRVDISYDADLRKAKELVQNILDHDADVMQEEDIKVFVHELADSSVIIGARAWVPTEKYLATKWRIQENIKLTFDENGIEIPFNQMVVHVKEEK